MWKEKWHRILDRVLTIGILGGIVLHYHYNKNVGSAVMIISAILLLASLSYGVVKRKKIK